MIATNTLIINIIDFSFVIPRFVPFNCKLFSRFSIRNTIESGVKGGVGGDDKTISAL